MFKTAGSGGANRVTIAGASVAGSRLAGILAGCGLEARLFDFAATREKPYGGRLTPKLFDEFSDLEACLKSPEM